MGTEIQDRIVKMEKIEWRKLTYFQNETLKELSKENYAKLEHSIITHGIVSPFYIWLNPKDNILYVIDGHYRIKTLYNIAQTKPDVKIPDIFNCVFIDCKDEKEAVYLVSIYNSKYAQMLDDGFYELLSIYEVAFDNIKMDINIPEIDLTTFEQSYYGNIEDISPDSEENQGKLDHPIIIECPKCGYKIEN